MTMTRFDALLLLRRRVRSRQVVQRCLAAEAVMRALASRFDGDPDLWGLAGLLCELDFEFCEHNPRRKGQVAAEILRTERGPEEIVAALAAHRAPGPDPEPLVRALAAAVPAVMILLDLAPDRAACERLAVGEAASMAVDPSVAPEASRTRIEALAEDGLGSEGLLEQARRAMLEAAEDIWEESQMRR